MAEALLDHSDLWPAIAVLGESFNASVKVANLGQPVNKGFRWRRDVIFLKHTRKLSTRNEKPKASIPSLPQKRACVAGQGRPAPRNGCTSQKFLAKGTECREGVDSQEDAADLGVLSST